MKRISVLATIFAVVSANAVTVVQWNFNSNPADASTGTGSTVASINLVGAGVSVANIGGVTNTFASGDANGGSTDPAIVDDSGYNTTTYAAQGAADKSAGVQFNVPTTGYKDIIFKVDTRHSNTSSRFVQVQYSTDGSTFADAPGGLFEATLGGDTWYKLRTVDFSAITAANNNPNFKVRIVSTFANGSQYFATTANTAAGYAATGTLRHDMATIEGTAVPEPATMLALGSAAAMMVSRRRKASA